MSRPMIVLLAVVGGALLLTGGCGSDGDLTSGGKRPAGDGDPIVAAMKAFYAEHSTYRVETELNISVKDRDGALIPGAAPPPESRTFAVQAPNKLSYGNQAGFQLMTDGREAVVAVDAFGKFWRGTAPESLDELTQPPFVFLFLGPENLRAILLALDPELAVPQENSSFEIVGEEQVGGVPSVRVRTTTDDASLTRQAVLELWIAKEGDPLLLKSVFTQPPRQLSPQLDGSLTYIEEYHDWDFAFEPTDDDFTFEKPEGARRMDYLLNVLEADPPLLGEPAPAVNLPLLEEGVLKLEELQGKVVLLDFWASWCKPCLDELPTLVKVVKDYEDRGVELYAINAGENRLGISSFLERFPLEMTVALDETMSAQRAFGVDGLPHLVVVGKDGTVQVIHTGYSEALAPLLRRELDQLLDDRNLARDGFPDDPVPEE